MRVAALAALLAGGVAAVAGGEERLAVLEFFGRPTGAYCSAAGPAMVSLQENYDGRAVLLEYDFDAFRQGRLDRFSAADSSAPYLPLVMVGSGYRTSDGPANYELVYRAMIEDERARPPAVEVSAAWRALGSRARVYLRLHNHSGHRLLVAEEAAIWVVIWQNDDIGVSRTWVRSTTRWPLPADLDDGAAVTAVVDTTGSLAGLPWGQLSCLAMVEERRPVSGRYDMLDAVVAGPPELTVNPATIGLSRAKPGAELTLSGPHVLAWTATSDVPWLELTPPSGDHLPATLSVVLVPELWTPGAGAGSVRVDAVGDGLALSTTVAAVVGGAVRRSGQRLRP